MYRFCKRIIVEIDSLNDLGKMGGFGEDGFEINDDGLITGTLLVKTMNRWKNTALLAAENVRDASCQGVEILDVGWVKIGYDLGNELWGEDVRHGCQPESTSSTHHVYVPRTR